MKHLFLIFACLFWGACACADEFDYGYFADYESSDMSEYDIQTTDDENASCNVTNVNINPGAEPLGVGDFDIAGIMLGMDFESAQMVARENGIYVNRPKNSVVYSMHKDWRYNLDYECRQQKIYVPAQLEKCINSLARSRGVLYASELHLVRDITGETIDVYFTSNATDNVVWKIVYKNDADETEGADEKFDNQRNKKIMSWWQNVLEKYGAPNADTDKWASSDNAYDPLMTAYYGELELVDCGRAAEDSTRNVRQAMDNFAAKPYAF